MDNNVIMQLADLTAKVNIIWDERKIIYAAIVLQIVLSIISVIKNGNGRVLRKEDYVLLKKVNGNGGTSNGESH